jgi:uncharacterized membrane protein
MTVTNVERCEYVNPEMKRLLLSVGGIASAAWAIRSDGFGRLFWGGIAIGLLRRSLQKGTAVSTEAGSSASPRPISGKAVITVRGDVQDIYNYWRDVTNAPKFMPAVVEVRKLSDNVSLWKYSYAAGSSLELTSEITEDTPGEVIGWNVIGSQLLRGTGLIQFNPSPVPGYTEVRMEQWVLPRVPFIKGLGSAVLARQIEQSLRNFKQLYVTGEIATSKGQPSGERSTLTQVSQRVIGPWKFESPRAAEARA